jgi:hypothetical protein
LPALFTATVNRPMSRYQQIGEASVYKMNIDAVAYKAFASHAIWYPHAINTWPRRRNRAAFSPAINAP